MRNTVLILFISVFQVFATGSYAQTKTISLAMNDATIREVLFAIQNQSEFYFLYNSELIDVAKKVDITIEEEKVDAILTRLFDKNEVDFLIKDRYIVLTPVGGNAELFAEQQQPAVSGTVTDESGQPLPGVTVVVKGTTQGTVTNVDGNYSLTNIPEDATLVFSFVGMQTQEIAVGNQTSINVKMVVDAIGIEEVVAIGYGTQRKMNLTGSVATVRNDVLVKTPAANTANTLAGRLPGLVVKQTSGQPGFDNPDINIRNFGNALVIVDGVEQSFTNIDPNEIESISILKDASAAIYGARAGNGVILVTTKRGKVSKPTFTYNGTVTGQSFTFFPEPVNAGQYATLYREAQINSGVPQQQLKYSEEDIVKYFDGTDPQYPNTNWMDIIMDKWTPQHQHNISMAGGTEKVKYYTFLGYLDQDVMFKLSSSGYKRYNVRSNLDVSITPELNLALDIAGIRENVQQPWRSSTNNRFWFWMDFFNAMPTRPSEYPDKTKIPNTGQGAQNPIINTNEELGGYDRHFKTTLNGSFTLDYTSKSIKGLGIKIKADYLQFTREQKNWQKEAETWNYDYLTDTYTLHTKVGNTALQQSYINNQTITGNFSLNYNRLFNEKHEVGALLLYEIIDISNRNFNGFRRNYLTSSIDQLFAGGTEDQQANGSAFESGRKSLVSRINYGYHGKYLMEATLRYDGSPNFPKDKRWGTFPSVSAAWRVSEESFIKDNLNWMSNLKLRGGISQTGFDAVAAYQYLAGYNFSGLYVVNGEEVPALITSGLPNSNITWETMTLSNIGLDIAVFDGKLFSEMDIFQRLRDDMLGTRVASLPNTFGATLPSENINSQITKGFEFLLGHRGQISDFKYDVSGNISYARSKWKHFDEVEYTDPDDIRINKKTGQWVDVIFGYKSDGLFTSQEEIDNLIYDIDGKGNSTLSPGDIIYIDINEDGKIDWRDRVKISNGFTPHIMYGLNMEMQYKRFDLSFFVQGAADYHLQVAAGILIDSERTPLNVIWEERWTPDNNDKGALIPRQKFGQTTNYWASDYWMKNAAFLRLKNVNLGYTFNPAQTGKIGIQQLRVFCTGTNLFTINPVKKFGMDPEGEDQGRTNNRGWNYPNTKTLSIGLNVTF